MPTLTDANTYPTAGIMTSKMFSLYDVGKPSFGNTLMRRFGYQYQPTFQMLKAMGREVPVANTEWSEYEDNWIHRQVKVKDTVADPGAGNTLTFVIDPAFLDSNNKFYLRKGEIITMPTSLVQAHVVEIDTTTPSAPAVTLMPARSTDNIGGVTAGDLLSITSAAYANGTGQPEGATVGVSKRNFQAQILKETVGSQGTELALQKWYQYYEGGDLLGWFTPGTAAADYRLALKIDGAFYVGVVNDNASLVVGAGEEGEGNLIKTTKGLIPTIAALGETDEYTSGSWAVTDLDAHGLYFKSQGISVGNVWWQQGAKLKNEVENEMVDFLQNTGVDFTRIQSQVFKSDGDMAVNIGFNVIKKGGITYFMTEADTFNNPMTFAGNAYKFQEYGFMIPMVSFQNPKSPGILVNNMETRYVSGNGYNRRMEVWDVRGAGGGTYVHDIDKMNHYLRAHLGFQFMKVNQMIWNKPA